MVKAYLMNRNELANMDYDEAIFSDGRRAKIEKISHDDDKELSACVELLLIYALKSLDENVKLPLEITEEESGNLLLETKVNGYEKIYFNMSHSKDYAACVVSDNPVGIDIETIKTKEVEHMDKILHPDEVLLLSFVSNPSEKKKYFYECWVSKESYLKNLGCGLSVRPNEFLVEEEKLVTELNNLEQRYVHVCKSKEIKNADFRFDGEYRLAICSLKKEPMDIELLDGEWPVGSFL